MTDYVLYGSAASLFTGKARAYLNWKNVPFEECAVNETVMKTVIMPNVGWPVVPVLQTPDGRIVQDTVDIIAEVEATHPEPDVMPEGPLRRFASLLMQVFADQWLLLPAMHYRWNYNEDWIFTEFGRSAAPDMDPSAHYEIGKKVGSRFRAMVPALGIDEATIPGIETSYEGFLTDFATHLEHHAFVFGPRPSLADFALIGPLHAHLYRDPASREIMERVAPNVARWAERTMAGQGGDAVLPAQDSIPETLLAIFKRHITEHLPVLMATNALFTQWSATAASGAEVPRALGKVAFTVEGCTGETMALPFSLFRLQAALDVLADVSGDDLAKVEAFLHSIGADALLSFKLNHRLERKNCKLCLV